MLEREGVGGETETERESFSYGFKPFLCKVMTQTNRSRVDKGRRHKVVTHKHRLEAGTRVSKVTIW